MSTPLEYSDNDIGKSLKTLRLKNGKSQLEVEIEAGLSEGSLSKIELGKVNPTHTTLKRILDVYKTDLFDLLEIYNIKPTNLVNIFKLIENISRADLNLEQTCQLICNKLPEIFNVKGVAINLVIGEKMYSPAFTQTWYSKFIIRLMPVHYKAFILSFEKNPDHPVVLSTRENTVITTNSLGDLLQPFVPRGVSSKIQRLARLESFQINPLVTSKNPFGVIVLALKDELTNTELDLIEAVISIISNILETKKQKEELVLDTKTGQYILHELPA